MAAAEQLGRDEGVRLSAAEQISALGVVKNHLHAVKKNPDQVGLAPEGTGWAFYLADAPQELTERELTIEQREDLRQHQGSSEA